MHCRYPFGPWRALLILGGTTFVGRHAAEETAARGNDVTLFNRGHDTATKGVTTIIGDRLGPGGYSSLETLLFDAVIDTWSTHPVAVKSAVEALQSHIGQYIYFSSGSAYNFEAEDAAALYSESTPLHDPEKADSQYVKDKIGGERYASQPGVPTAFIRAGVIPGPYEMSGVCLGGSSALRKEAQLWLLVLKI
jgi:nucleoside-diphosphate-sugar epimerase